MVGGGAGAKRAAAPAAAPAAAVACTEESEASKQRESLVAGYLNLAADAAHNFTDGLLLGGAYTKGFWTGVPTTLAILMHEVPHEVGDIAILMQAGFAKSDAIRAQLCTAFGALAGTLVAIATGEQQADLLLNFTAGGFIYVATVDVLPPLLAQPSSAFQTAMQMLAMCTGVAMMVIVIAFE